jgi:hypothetical protein
MTNLEALKAKVQYPLDDESFQVALEGRSLTYDDVFDIAENKQAFQLAYADCLCSVLTAPSSVSEGGYSVSQGDKKTIIDIVSRIYKRYGEPMPVNSPTATFVRRW